MLHLVAREVGHMYSHKNIITFSCGFTHKERPKPGFSPAASANLIQ